MTALAMEATPVNGTVLLLAPSRGLGGGIERYVSTVEAAFVEGSVRYRRIDLLQPGYAGGLRRRLEFVHEVRRAVRCGPAPVRLVLAHRNLLPVVPIVSRCASFAAATVILHGSELWAVDGVRGARTMRRSDVRVVAASNFTAGAVAGVCRSRVLHPGVNASWYDLLVEAGTQAQAPELRLVTAFRLAMWREKGLPTLLTAIRLLADDQLRLTVCGSGPVPDDLRAAVAPHPWCELAADLSDRELAGQMARAYLFVLCTRTRAGAGSCGEGFGLVLLEAQLAGTPVVAPAHGGSGDAFVPDVTGVAPMDETPQALAAVLGPLLADRRRRAELAQAAAAWARSRFEPARYGRRIIQTLLDDGALPAMAGPTARALGAAMNGTRMTGEHRDG
jgi:phosphatidyl-myo-inositol dimannoside synthase